MLVFLRDDIYQALSFEDRNKLTQNYTSRIEWDTARTARTLKQLMEKRFAEVLSIPEANAWNEVFDENEQMSGRQNKYQHMVVDRTFLRPRDMIQFTNEVLRAFQKAAPQEQRMKFNNRDVQMARTEYSAYLLSELYDEIPKHYPNYRTYLEILKSMESLQFTLADFEQGCASRATVLPPDTALPLSLQPCSNFRWWATTPLEAAVLADRNTSGNTKAFDRSSMRRP